MRIRNKSARITRRALGSAVAFALASAVSLCSGAAVFADDAARSPVVVELFTSQGCSACPPADAMLGELAERDDVIALALHVDYWDYIGWKDVFARPEHMVRQKAYARAAGEQMIYTPQMIVGGKQGVMGGRAMAIIASIDAVREAAPRVALRLTRADGVLIVDAEPLAALPEKIVLQLVRYRPYAEVEILRGENAGRTLAYTNIVTEWDIVAEWDGGAPLSLQLDLAGDLPAVMILQDTEHGPILAAGVSP
ncbi:MAG: DUF1223 domain-containing protein [Pseudomonadota bacterium]